MSTIAKLKVNFLDSVTGITASPRFSWVIESPFRNSVQKSYQIQIADDASFASVLFDTGVVDSAASAHVTVAEFLPEEGVSCFARVRVTTEADGEGAVTSGYSPSVKILGGMKKPEELKTHFITAEKPKDKESAKGTYLRKEIVLVKDVKSAVIFSTAQGLYQLHLNGAKVSGDQLAPGWTSYDRRLLYQSYDVSGKISRGKNVIGAHLGAGWYKGGISFLHIKNFYGDFASLSLRLDVVYTDGSGESFYSNESWKGHISPVVKADIYNGEEYDARLEQPGWDLPGFDDSSWDRASSCICTSEAIEAQEGSPVVLNEVVSPQLAFNTPKNERVIDFGQNMSALPEITGQGEAGDRIILTCFEVLDRDGNVYIDNLRGAEQKITYTLKDNKPFAFIPHFTFYGFRFIHVESFCGRADLDNFRAHALYSEMEQTGTFECSHPGLNRLQQNILWGLKSNFVDVPTDCPQRDERMGWTGDAQIFCRTAAFNMNSYTFFSKWLRDLALDQKTAGGVPHVVPDLLNKYSFDNWLLNQGTHSAAAWADAAVINPWVLYLTFGDIVILEKQYESMKALIDFMGSHSKDNIWNYKLQFGDWVALDAEEGSYFGATPNDLTCTAYFAYSTDLFVKICRILGKDEAAREYESLQKEIVQSFQKTFFNKDGTMTAQTQTAHILALHFDLAPREYIPQTVKGLKTLLDKENGHLVTGFVGTPYFCHALSSNGCLDEAYDLLLKDDFPSWLYQVKKGATTIWEHWDGIKPDGSMWSPNMNSFNHYAYGAIGEWLYRVAAGIDTDENRPGYAHSIIAPRIGGGLDYVKSSYASIYGTVGVHWQVEKGGNGAKRITLQVTVPANTSSTIKLMDGAVLIDGDGLEFAEKKGILLAEAGSGLYHILYEL
ncbi:MAG: family 78 glycoside hydrolase catalytic domain [Spirochaetales bacterium]|nr:family 78 glycoside hydrolase catalytic domain [Spirochaetales bacterium]